MGRETNPAFANPIGAPSLAPRTGAQQQAPQRQPSHALQSDGLGLLALGALLVVAGLVAAGAPRGLDGTPMGEGRPAERVGWSLNGGGGLLVVVGSVLVLIGDFPHGLVLWASLLGALLLLIVCWCVSGSRLARKLPGWR